MNLFVNLWCWISELVEDSWNYVFGVKVVKFKKLHPSANLPNYATDGSAGMDLTATSLNLTIKEKRVSEHRTISVERPEEDYKYVYGTGLAIEIPKDHVGLLFPRSSVSKTGMSLANCVGVLDSDFRDEVKLVFNWAETNRSKYEVGERVGQLVILKLPKLKRKEVSSLSKTARGTGGFGSTGK